VAASTVYVINDLVDQKADQNNSKKQFRPLPSGRLSRQQAGMILVSLLVFLIALLVRWPAIWPVIIVYLILNLLYSGWLKNVIFLDIITVAVFYVLRVVAGGFSTGLHLSNWILFCTFFGSLFVITGKRRAEFEQMTKRKVLNQYSKSLLDLILITTAFFATFTYLMWAIFSSHNNLLAYSSLLVAAALGFLFKRIHTEPVLAESPESLVLKDPWILTTFCLWVVFVFSVFYLV